MVGVTVMAAVVSVVLHTYDTPPLAVSVLLLPLHIAAGDGLIAAVGLGFMVTVPEAVAVQVLASVTVTV